MSRLEDITVGATIEGIAAGSTVTIIAVAWHGNTALTVTFKESRWQSSSGDSLPRG